MDLVWAILLFLLGLGLLVKGADWLVEGAAKIAKRFGVSDLVIGLTIVACGTSLPEFCASVAGSFYGNSAIAMGNIVGSNIANIAFILALAGIVAPFGVKKGIYARDGLIMLLTAVLFYLFSLDLVLTTAEGGILLFLFFLYIAYFITSKRPFWREFHFGDFRRIVLFKDIPKAAGSVGKSLPHKARAFQDGVKKAFHVSNAEFFYYAKVFGMLFLGVICLYFGAQFVIDAAESFPLDQLLIGLIFVAVGTSLPELFVTISSMKRKMPEIMVGNIVGSNIVNILWVGGSAAIVSPLTVPAISLRSNFIFMLFITWLFLVFLRNDRKITRLEAATLLLFYAAFVATTLGITLGL